MSLKLYVGVINLFERDDRFLNAQQQFAKVHPEGKMDEFLGFPVHVHRVHRHPKGGRFGCYTSHLMVMQAALDAGCNACLVLEDDFTFLDHKKTYVNNKLKVGSESDLEGLICGPAKDSFDILHLSHEKMFRVYGKAPSGLDESLSLNKVNWNVFSHCTKVGFEAYIVPVHTMRAFLEHGPSETKHIDDEILQYTDRSLTLTDPVCHILPMGSDNSDLTCDRTALTTVVGWIAGILSTHLFTVGQFFQDALRTAAEALIYVYPKSFKLIKNQMGYKRMGTFTSEIRNMGVDSVNGGKGFDERNRVAFAGARAEVVDGAALAEWTMPPAEETKEVQQETN